jgi:importin subunit alpha-6/7
LALVYDLNDVKVVFAAIGLRKLISHENNGSIQIFVDSNLVPRLLELLQKSYFPKIQYEAAWCLTNIASGNNDQVQVLLKNGAIKAFIMLLNSPHLSVVDHAIWGLGNIAGESHLIRDLVLNEDAVLPISNILDNA